MTDPFYFSDVVKKFKNQSGLSYAQLAERAGLPNKTTVSNWANGVVRQPRQWQDIVRLAVAMRLNEQEASELLQAASYPSVVELLAEVREESDRLLLAIWEQDIARRLQQAPFYVPYADPPLLVGREEYLENIQRHLMSQTGLCIISGMGGVGKTALAIRVAYQLQSLFPDGVLWATVKGRESLQTALLSLARAYDDNLGHVDDLDAVQGVVRNILANKRALIIFDNVQRGDELQSLLSATRTSQCVVLVTTRNRALSPENQGSLIAINPLAVLESFELFTAIIGETRAQEDEDSLAEIINMLGGLPLALRLVANYLVQSKEIMTTDEYLGSLRDEQTRLKTLTQDGQSDESFDLEACFELSFKALSEPAKELFPLLSIFPGPTFSAESVLAITSTRDVKKCFVEFKNLSLLELSEVGQELAYRDLPFDQRVRYEFHRLIRLFAQRRLRPDFQVQLSPQDLRQILTEYFDEDELRDLCFDLAVDYQDFPGSGKKNKAREIVQLFMRQKRQDKLKDYIVSQRPVILSNRSKPTKSEDELRGIYIQAINYFVNLAYENRKLGSRILDLERENIIGFLNWAYHNKEWESLLKGVKNLTYIHLGVIGYLDACGWWQQAIKLLQHALNAPSVQEDKLLRATILLKLGGFSFRQMQIKEAEAWLNKSLELLDELPENQERDFPRAYAYEFLAEMAIMEDPKAALTWSQKGIDALAPFESPAIEHEIAYLQIRRAPAMARSGNLSGAQEITRKALMALPDYPTTARISGLMTYGIVADILGDYPEARESWQAGVELAEKLGDHRRLAGLWRNLAIQAEKVGHTSESIEYNEKALRYYRQISDLAGEGHTTSNLGVVYLLLGDSDAAAPYVRRALEIAQAQEVKDLKVFANVAMARWLLVEGQPDRAKALLVEAQEWGQEIGLTEIMAEIRRLQAMIASQRGEYGQALALIEESLLIADEEGQIVETGSSWRVKGDILSASDMPEAANEAYQTSVTMLFERYPLHRARAELAWTRHCLSQGEFAMVRELLMRAEQTFGNLQAAQLAKQVYLIRKGLPA